MFDFYFSSRLPVTGFLRSLFTLTFFAKMCYVGFGNKTKNWDDQISQIIKWRR